MTPAMPSDTKPNLTPKLRFPEFRDGPEWSEEELRTIADPVSERADNEDENNILTLSAEQGIVLQSEYFGKQVAGTNADRYLKIQRDDFVYNDRVTKASAYGTIKRLTKHPHGIVSPIYKCFRFKNGEQPGFWEWYFEAGAHESELRGIASEGARAGRFNVSIERFLSTNVRVPDPGEQQKIAECLSTLDDLIGAESQKLDALQAHKKGLMQQLFPREGETLPRLRFPEFRNTPEWTTRKLGDFSEVSASGDLDDALYSETETDEHRYPVFSNAVENEGLYGYYSRPRYPKNSVTITARGTLGVAFLRRHDFMGIGRLVVVSKITEAEPAFVRDCWNHLANVPHEVTSIPQLTAITVRATFLPMPEPDEQKRIATCLSSLDDLIVAQSDKLEALKAHKRGLMQQLFPSPAEAAA